MSAVVRELLAIGRIVKAFGVKGEIVVSPMTDSTERFRDAKNVFVGRTDVEVRQFDIDRVAVEPRGVRAKLSGVDTRTEAEGLVGHLMFVDPAHRVRLEKGRHFIHEMIGLKLVDQDGRPLGVLKDVLKLPAHDVYVVDRNGREILLPAVKEFVVSVDMVSRTITMKLIEGMLDE